MRTEFGRQRTECSCQACIKNCRFMPGNLIPADLDRMIPPTLTEEGIFRWAEQNLRASPGALVGDSATGHTFRIPMLVPAVKKDGSCIHLQPDERCAIHENAPFGCAFFDCGPEPQGLSREGLWQIAQAHRGQGAVSTRAGSPARENAEVRMNSLGKAILTIWHKKKQPPIEVSGNSHNINELRNFIIRRCRDSGIPAMAMSLTSEGERKI
jgi:Fe-S-cluster containining protein